MVLAKLRHAGRVAYNAILDLRYGRPLTGAIDTRFGHLGARHTVNSDYLAMDMVFADRVRPGDVLVDVGCGKGRVINWWLRHHDQPAYGIELDPDIAADTRRRLRRFAQITIITGNVLDALPPDGTLYYLYNPFESHVVEQFADRLAALGRERQLPIRVLYNHCKHLQVFLDRPQWHVDLLPTSITDPFDRVAVIDLR